MLVCCFFPQAQLQSIQAHRQPFPSQDLIAIMLSFWCGPLCRLQSLLRLRLVFKPRIGRSIAICRCLCPQGSFDFMAIKVFLPS